jgi:hypothetical protein
VTSVAWDANCLVALALTQHMHHPVTKAALDRTAEQGHEIVMLSHAVLEAYSVLTRLPSRDRIEPEMARQSLFDSWSGFRTVALDPESLWPFLDQAVGTGVRGARIYDTMLVHAALAAGVDLLLTWNVRHLGQLTPGTPAVMSPEDFLLR